MTLRLGFARSQFFVKNTFERWKNRGKNSKYRVGGGKDNHALR